MEYSIVRIDTENYPLYDDMIFFRINNRERTSAERAEPRDYAANFAVLADKNLRVYAAKVDDRFVGWISAVFIPKTGHPRYGG